jgi:hypothetical protein
MANPNRLARRLDFETPRLSSVLVRLLSYGVFGTFRIGNRPKAHMRCKRWLHKFGRYDKWNFCLTTGTLVPANQERQ